LSPNIFSDISAKVDDGAGGIYQLVKRHWQWTVAECRSRWVSLEIVFGEKALLPLLSLRKNLFYMRTISLGG
jgi:uncharacterized protein affecting Mg2+/Co2+ transport